MDVLFQFSNVLLYLFIGFAFVMGALVVGTIFRPGGYERDKARIYECGEPTIGSSWIRYNIRFYTVALVFLVFDVEIVALLPVAIVLREMGMMAFFEVLFFVVILFLGFIYAWRFGALEWIKGTDDETAGPLTPSASTPVHDAAAAAKEQWHD